MRHHLLNTAFWREMGTLDQTQRLLIAEAVEHAFRKGVATAAAEASAAALKGRPRRDLVKWAARCFSWWCATPPRRKWRVAQSRTDGSEQPPRVWPLPPDHDRGAAFEALPPHVVCEPPPRKRKGGGLC